MATPARLLTLLLTFMLAWGAVAQLRPGFLTHGSAEASAGGPSSVSLWRLDPSSAEFIGRMRRFAKALPTPEPGDWLAEHSEPGQSFEEYVNSDPPIARGDRRVLYVAPLGAFSEVETALLHETVEYMGSFFGLPVEVLDGIPLTVEGDSSGSANVPRSAFRSESSARGFGAQFHSQWILQKLLRPRLPMDGVALIGLTARDLWPGQGWNFVFGQADLKRRVGVWSMARFGDPALSPESRALVLRRTFKVATHETGHMLGMRHCTAYSCNMNGSNHLQESDRQPLELCPVCTAKLVHATEVQLPARSAALAGLAADLED